MHGAECQFIFIWESFTEGNLNCLCKKVSVINEHFFLFLLFYLSLQMWRFFTTFSYPVFGITSGIIRIFLDQILNIFFFIAARAYLATNRTVHLLPVFEVDFIWNPIKLDCLIIYLCRIIFL